jgi:SAM-dependent methyltransferase
MDLGMANDPQRSVGETELSLSNSSIGYQRADRGRAAVNASTLKSRRERHRLRLDQVMLRRYLLGPDVLDFPVGTGRLLEFTFQNYNLYGYDISPVYIELAKEAYPEISEHFEAHSMELISNPRQFNSIYSLRVTRHIKDFPRAVASMAQILAPGGRWIFNIAPEHPSFAQLPMLLSEHDLLLRKQVKYDAYSGCASLTGFPRYIFARWMQLVELFPVPFWMYRLVDTLFLPFTFTILIVAEKRTP